MGTASGLRRLDADYEAALVANAVLGQNALASRIGKRVRDTEGLSYNLYSRFAFSEEIDGLWLVNVNLAPPNLAKAYKSTREEIDKYAREGATAAEVQVQKDHFAGNYQVNLGSNAGMAAALLTAERYGFGPSYLDDFPKRIQAVTLDEANAALKKYFHPSRLNLVVAGDIDKLPD
jgi:zinc protease